MDEAVLTTDGLGPADPDRTPGAQPIAESSPATAAAAAADVEFVPGLKQEEAHERQKQAQREIDAHIVYVRREPQKLRSTLARWEPEPCFPFKISAENLSKNIPGMYQVHYDGQ